MKWRIRDIIDLEYFLHQDTVLEPREHLHARDRSVFLDCVMPEVTTDRVPDRQFIIRIWLEKRRETAKAESHSLPGENFEGLYRSCRSIFLVAGLLLGGAAGVSFLTYTGGSPVNVFVYLALFVISQLLLLLLLLVLSLYRLSAKSFPASSPLYAFISRYMLRILLSARNKVSSKVTADKRQQAEAAFGTIVGKARAYGPIFFLPLFILTQLFAVGFNLGLLGSTLFKVVTADIAFGWQSTIQLSPTAVHALAQNIALPWAWAVQGDAAHPSLSQIEGSRIILKEGIYHLSTPDLVSWWPFLCFAVLAYGLLPRLLLCAGAVAAQRRYLRALTFRQGIYEQLLLRMTTPLVSTHGRSVDVSAAAAPESSPTVPAEVKEETGWTTAKKLLVLIPDEISDSCSPAEIASVVNREARYATQEVLHINQDYAADREMLAGLQERERMTETDILLIQEAWQPPILEYIDFIKDLRKAIGADPCIRIGLIGKPGPGTIFTPATEENLQIWNRIITAIGDPCIYCEGLVHNAS
jgi:hypothetical protein